MHTSLNRITEHGSPGAVAAHAVVAAATAPTAPSPAASAPPPTEAAVTTEEGE